jgi:hypothetical protein
MTLETPHTHDRRIGRRHPNLDHIVWEPQLPRRLFRRRPWEQATIVETSLSGALVQAHTNRAIGGGTRISIAVGADRGLVVVRHVDPAPMPLMSYYGVEFVWLDPNLRARLDDDVISLR